MGSTSPSPRGTSKSEADRMQETAVEQSFPASDPPPSPSSKGVRAVSPEEMMAGDAAPPRDAVELTQAFPDAEAAKLALETLVRDAPIDRRCGEVLAGRDGKGATLKLTLPPADRPRVAGLLAGLA